MAHNVLGKPSRRMAAKRLPFVIRRCTVHHYLQKIFYPIVTINVLPHITKKTEGNFNHTEGNFTLTEGRRTLILDKKRLKMAKFAQSVSKWPTFEGLHFSV